MRSRCWGFLFVLAVLIAQPVFVFGACNGHGLNSNWEIHWQDSIAVTARVRVVSQPAQLVPAHQRLNLGYVAVGQQLGFHVQGSDPDKHVCRTGDEQVWNYMESTVVGVDVILKRGNRPLAHFDLDMTPPADQQTARTRFWDGFWPVVESLVVDGNTVNLLGETLIFKFTGAVDDIECGAEKHKTSRDHYVTMGGFETEATVLKVDIGRRQAIGLEIITDKISDVNVGEKISLEGVISPATATINPGTWTIPGYDSGPNPKAIKSYRQSLERAAVETISENDLTSSHITYFWVDGGSNLEVKYSVTVGGAGCAVKTTFNVKRPSSTFASVLTEANPPVDVRDNVDFSGQMLVFGEVVVEHPGIVWSPVVTTGVNAAGRLALVQVISMETVSAGSGNFSHSSGGYVLDASLRDVFGIQTFVVPYADAETSIGSNETKTHQRSSGDLLADTPLIDFNDYEVDIENTIPVADAALTSLTRSDQFKTYLMYKPNGADSIWVSLSKMTWSWAGKASKDAATGAWSLDAGSGSSPSTAPTGSNTIELPEWSNYMQAILPKQVNP